MWPSPSQGLCIIPRQFQASSLMNGTLFSRSFAGLYSGACLCLHATVGSIQIVIIVASHCCLLRLTIADYYEVICYNFHALQSFNQLMHDVPS